MPQELDTATRRLMQLEIEEAALKKEKDRASKDRLGNLRKELADLRATTDALKAQWDQEKGELRKLQELREEIEQVRQEIEVAERNYDLNRAAELKHGQLPQLEQQLQRLPDSGVVVDDEHVHVGTVAQGRGPSLEHIGLHPI